MFNMLSDTNCCHSTVFLCVCLFCLWAGGEPRSHFKSAALLLKEKKNGFAFPKLTEGGQQLFIFGSWRSCSEN